MWQRFVASQVESHLSSRSGNNILSLRVIRRDARNTSVYSTLAEIYESKCVLIVLYAETTSAERCRMCSASLLPCSYSHVFVSEMVEAKQLPGGKSTRCVIDTLTLRRQPFHARGAVIRVRRCHSPVGFNVHPSKVQTCLCVFFIGMVLEVF